MNGMNYATGHLYGRFIQNNYVSSERNGDRCRAQLPPSNLALAIAWRAGVCHGWTLSRDCRPWSKL